MAVDAKTTFGALKIGDRFVMADSPQGEMKVKTGFGRWKWVGHEGFLPTAIGCRPDREVIRLAGGGKITLPGGEAVRS